MPLFRSRTSRVVRATKGMVWPKKSFLRGWIYIGLRILRLRSSDYSLAAGFAAGVFASMTPFIGTHFVIAAGLAWLIRGNMAMSLIGTLAGNPWTFPLIWVGTYTIGTSILGVERVVEDVSQLDFGLLMEYPGKVLISMTVGSFVLGLPLGGVVLLIGYSSAGSIRSWLNLVGSKHRKRRRKGN